MLNSLEKKLELLKNHLDSAVDCFVHDRDLSNLDTIQRWDLNRVISKETVSQHSFWVVLISTIFAEILTDRLDLKYLILRYAITHDVPEIFSGDINHVVKRNKYNGKEISKLLDEFCDSMMSEKFGRMEFFNDLFCNLFEGVNKDDVLFVKKVVKLADWTSFLRYIEAEKSLGNTNLLPIKDYCVENINLIIRDLSCCQK